ncbi:MAG: ABC-F family ATP-binding cassette domain-containing protein [Pseudomonadota bacterium]
MLRISDITYAVEGRRLFEGASATIPSGHKVGLVGPNGAGKTTLFRLIRGEIALESGEIALPKGTKIGGVAQEAPASDQSLLDTVLEADTERTALLAEQTDDANRIAEIQTRLTDIDAWSAEARAATILKGLGFDEPDQHRPCADFSGGWRMRVALAAVLFAQPDLLLLDEPTNYLDLEGALWLESYLKSYPHTVIIISHDRNLLNRAVGSILHLDHRQLTFYQGTFDAFAKARAAKRAVQAAEAKKQEAKRAHLQSYVDRFRYKADKAKQAQSRIKALERMDIISAPEAEARSKFTFPEPEELSPPIVNLDGAAVGYGGDPVLQRLSLRIDQDDRIALLGKNGQGKSTLAKLLSERLQAEMGRVTRASKLRVGYFAQHQVDELEIDQTPLDHLRALRPDWLPGRLRPLLAGFGLGPDQADTEVKRLSGGQKARLSLLLATLDAPHMLILDEPTNHLDMESREALVEALAAYKGAVILVSHDMHLLGLVADRLWLVSDGTVIPYEDDLEAYRRFLLQAPAPKEKSKRPPKPSKDAVSAARAEAKKCETRIEKLSEMHRKLQAKLADPALYEPERAPDREVWQKKFAEVEDAMAKAELLWMAALETLEEMERA